MTDPLFKWLDHRAAGVLLHPTSLPGEFGIGNVGRGAVRFLEFLARAGFRYWQICPLGPTGYGDSPYQCFSAFAGNPYLIDLEELAAHGLIEASSLEPLRALPRDRVDYGRLWQQAWTVLHAAHAAVTKRPELLAALPYGSFETFKSDQASWLESYTLFRALKDHFAGRPWWEWPEDCGTFARAKKSKAAKAAAGRADAHAFFQYLFFGQWRVLRARARQAGVELIGDLPIFVARDSADIWADPRLFQVDVKSARLLACAGVPPDYFSAEGQLWGNPLYQWPAHAADGYAWWKRRLEASFALHDVVRIDHFRGFDTYWAIPDGAENAQRGRWEAGPGLPFFHEMKTAFPSARIIAEDLGELTPDVVRLRQETGLPGMAILQFAFGGEADNFYLPHNLRANSVVYPGTHDNDTTLGWYRAADEKTRDHVRRYFRVSGQEIGWDFIRAALGAVSNLAILPMQDLLSLGGEARFNTPGRATGNWEWRLSPEALEKLERDGTDAYLRELGVLYGRIGKPAATTSPS